MSRQRLSRPARRSAAGDEVERLLQPPCRCGAGHGDSYGCARCARPHDPPQGLQWDAPVGRHGDHHEREADRVAVRVLRDSTAGVVTPIGAGSGYATDAARPAAGCGAPTPDGQPLPATERQFFESRFGHDFSRVRIHTGPRAASLARGMRARALTLGRDIVFAAGQYRPGQAKGRRLLAHELTHVVQQRGKPVVIQREEENDDKDAKPSKAKRDVSIVLTEESQDMDEGRTYAKQTLRVFDVDDVAKKLKALDAPIGTLFVVSHSSSAGKIQFVSKSGSISWVEIDKLAKALQGKVAIDDVDFRGCKIGSAAGAMESFRKTIGAQSTRGSNCWTFVSRVTPLTLDGVEVTKPSQIPKRMKQAFDKALMNQINGLVTADNKPVKDCLLGLAKGEKATWSKLPKVWQQYWANDGNLVASWASPKFNEDWQQGSICTKDMTTGTTPCAIVETKAPAGGNKGAMLLEQPAGRQIDVAEERAYAATTSHETEALSA